MSYLARIAKIHNIRKHSNADRLQIGYCFGSQVIVDINAKDGDLVVFFDSDGQLSEEYCKENNLYNKPEMNKDPNAKCGFFDHRRRVRAQTFRGEKSEAYVANLNTLSFTGYDISSFKEGDAFSELNGVSICNKYFTEATKKQISNGSKTQKGYNKEALKKLFPEHVDTSQLKYVDDKDLCGLVTITAKLHGTSGRTAYIKYPIKNEYKWYQKLSAFFQLKKLPEYTIEYQKVFGTRRVIKGIVTENATDYRSLVSKQIEPYMQKDEIWYYEIVGFEDSGASIMQSVSTEKMPKDFRKRFGDTITYKYGCLPGTYDFYVYRIMVKTEDREYELPWSTVKDRCNRAGIKHVPEVDQFIARSENHKLINYDADDYNYDDGYARYTIKEYIKYLCEETDIADPIDPSHIKEGYVVRVDSLDTEKTKLYKEKTFEFKVLEGIIKDSDTYVDEEESQGELE